MSDSKLVSYTNISPSRNSPRKSKIDTITIHCMAGQMTAKGCADMFAVAANRVSSNYCIGYDGKIAQSCPEADRSWCSSSGENDHRAITIEVASDKDNPCNVKPAAYTALLDLVTDICKRNGIKQLVWSANKADRVDHKNGCNMTVHRDYANKACPGDYLMGKMPEIAKEVNARLGSTTAKTTTTAAAKEMYRVRKTWADAASQVGAFSSLANAKACCDKNPGYTVFNNAGKAVYTAALKSITEVAKEVVAGKWGNGTARKSKLTAAGYNYTEVQAAVNKLLKG